MTPKKSISSPYKRQGKNTIKRTQLQTIFHYLQLHTVTASMLSDATGIPHNHICRYKRDLELSGKLWEIEKKTCQLTGHKAWYLTTDPKKAPNPNN